MDLITSQILKGIDTIVEQRISELNYDITVEAVINGLVDLDKGEYKVKYNGNIFSAFSSDLNYTYKIGDNVYLKIPEGDFTKKKIIEDKVSSKSLSEVDITELENSLSPVGPTLDKFFGYDYQKEYGIVAGEHSSATIYSSNAVNNAGFLQYANHYEYIRIKAKFKALLNDLHTKGNYGLEIEFFTKGELVNGQYPTVVYRLDFSSFNGNPYLFNTYSEQFVVIKTQKNFLLGIKSIKLFEEEFEYDKYIENGDYVYIYRYGQEHEIKLKYNKQNGKYYYTDNSGKVIYVDNKDVIHKENTTIPNIFVKDIELQYVEQKNLINNLYYLRIWSPQGRLFTDSIREIELEGQLIHKGQNVLTSENSICTWYEKDYSIYVGNEQYDKNAGFGWRKLSSTNYLSIDGAKMTLQQNYVKNIKEFKLIVTYNESVVMSEEIKISRQDAQYDCEIVQSTDGDHIKLAIKNNINSNQSLKGNWYYGLPDGTYQPLENAQKVNSIFVESYLIYSSIVFYCEVYDILDQEIIQNLTHQITNSESEADLTVTYEGEDSFRYDANGDITIEDSEKERTLQCNIAWKQGFGTSYTLEWLLKDGTSISKNAGARTQPVDSMIDSLWVDSSNILHYNIKQRYRISYNNNSIIIRIKTIDEKIYDFEKEIIFVKDGDQGTNGTTYILAVRPCDSSGNKLSGLNPMYYKNNIWTGIRLKAYVYKEGELINNGNFGSSYDFTYKWQGVNLKDDNTIAKDQITYQAVGGSTNYATGYCARCEVRINDKQSGKRIDIYALYPIDVVVGSNYDLSSTDIQSIPSYIKYTSSGLTPSFYSNALKYLYKGIDYFKNIVALNPTLLSITDKKDDAGEIIERNLKPASKFICDNGSQNLGVLKLPSSTDANTEPYLIHSIIMYLDTYGNEAINGWDGTKLELNEKGGYILAPQIGAGEKDSSNRFTGVVMGKDSGQSKIGLYGYQKGECSFGLMEDGTAFFGKQSSGGRITIDGNSAIITGGGGSYKDSTVPTMTLTLTDKNNSGSTRAISLSNDAFYLTYEGYLRANNVSINGKVTATYLWATEGGKIADFDFDDEGMSGGSITCNYLYASTRGEIGGFTIDNNKLTGGHIECNYLKANVKGEIGGWTIGTQSLSGGNTTLDSINGISTNKINVNNVGELGMVNTGAFGIRSGSNNITLDAASIVQITPCLNVAQGNSTFFKVASDQLWTNIDANNQTGIYAQFA